LVVGTTVAVDVTVGLALGAPATVKVLVAVANGVLVRVAVPVHVGAGELVEVRVGVLVAIGASVRVLVAVATDAVGVRLGTRVDVGTGDLVGVRVAVAVAVPRGVRSLTRSQKLIAASERNALHEMNRTTKAVSEYLKRQSITISLPRMRGKLFANEPRPNKRYAPRRTWTTRTFSGYRRCGRRRSKVGRRVPVI